MKHYVFLWTVLFAGLSIFAQDSTVHTLKGVNVTASKKRDHHEISSMQVLSVDSLSNSPSYNITEVLSAVPGLTALSTGPSISKPVIRGLYGSRILILVNGLRFSNQQWQDEHGMSMSDMGLGSVNVLKGPASVFYGSQAMGGVIDLRDALKSDNGFREVSIENRLYSNTLGGRISTTFKENKGSFWYGLGVSYDSQGDYTDGNNKRVLNSRYSGLNAKAAVGFKKGRWISENHYTLSSSQSGFIFNDVFDFIEVDDRLSRSLANNPSHLIDLHLFSSENTIRINNSSKFNVNVGYNSNHRRENEGGNAISLDMQLSTIQYLIKWEKKLSDCHELIISNMMILESNKNLGKRKIIPNANTLEGNISVVLNSILSEKVVLQNGLSNGLVRIESLETESVNSVEKDIAPFTRQEDFANVFSSIHLFPKQKVDLKAVVSSGTRIPNLAELSSNGLHEGIFTYEIGNPDFNKETCLAINVQSDMHFGKLSFAISPYFSYFKDFVYLSPTDEDWFGFPVYRYDQQDARLYGLESGMFYDLSDRLSLSISHEFCENKRLDGNYIPYLPAQRIKSKIEWDSKTKKVSAYLSNEYCFEQKRIAEEENPSPSYSLIHAGISYIIDNENINYLFSLYGSNLGNVAYFDHLSRLKNFGVMNMGRNLMLSIKINFKSKIQARKNQ